MNELLEKAVDGVLMLTLNRPAVRNALTPGLRDAIEASLQRFEADPTLRVAVLTGAGQKAFCAGSDLKVARVAASGPTALAAKDRPLVPELPTGKPVIAAINGGAYGGGLELALLCDIRIAASHAVFALPEARIGSIAGAGGTQRLPRLVGLGAALLMGLTGEAIAADEALRLGLVDRVVPAAELLPAALALAHRIAGNAPLSVRATRRAMREGLDLPLAAGLALERLLFTLIRDSEDRQEGRVAFREKRPPVFRGR